MNRPRIYIDFKSGPAYLALGPTLSMLDGLGVDAEWRPFETRAVAPGPARDEESRGEMHLRVRAEQRRLTCLRYAAIQGLPMSYPEQPGHTLTALAALLFVQTAPLPFIQAAFTGYWRDNLDLDDEQVVKGLLSDSGYDAAGFDALRWSESLVDHQRAAEQSGVFDTPIFALGDELFLGREQLPWISELLADQS